MNEYMLVMTGRSKDWKSLGPEESQRLMEKYYAFVEILRNKHGFVGGSALNQAGFSLSGNGGGIVDGPFPETKEVLNGYMVFKAPDFDAAVELAKQCPALTHGESIQLFEQFNEENHNA